MRGLELELRLFARGFPMMGKREIQVRGEALRCVGRASLVFLRREWMGVEPTVAAASAHHRF